MRIFCYFALIKILAVTKVCTITFFKHHFLRELMEISRFLSFPTLHFFSRLYIKSTTMRKLFLLLLIVLSACQNTNEIRYEVSSIQKNDKPALNISMKFKANPSGETVLIFQDSGWGEENK